MIEIFEDVNVNFILCTFIFSPEDWGLNLAFIKSFFNERNTRLRFKNIKH